MIDMEKKRKELQIIKANSTIAELEFKILEHMENIKRIEDHIKLQQDLINKVQKELNGGL